MKILNNSLAGGIEKKSFVWVNKNFKIRDIFVVLFCYFQYKFNNVKAFLI
jgi:hypothetical protein